MAFAKIVDKPGYSDHDILEKVIRYITDPCKAIQGLIGGFNLLPLSAEFIIEQMEIVKIVWHKTEGKQIRHFIVSFAYWENVSEIEAYRLAYYLAAYYADRYQIVYAVHEDKPNVHIHFIVNTVSYKDGLMYAEGKDDYTRLQEYIFCELNTGFWREQDKEPKKFPLNNRYIF